MSVYPDYLLVSSKRYRQATQTPRYRFMWDDQNPHWNFKCRTQHPDFIGPDNPPAVNKFYNVPDDKSGDLRINLEKDPSWRWWDTFAVINDGDYSDVEYVQDDGLAIFNTTGWPKMAYLGFSGNVVNVLARVGSWFKFETLKPTDWLRAQSMSNETHPQFIHSFSCVTWVRDSTLPAGGFTRRIESTGTRRGRVYVPMVTWEGYAWSRHVIGVG
jgi:hypothetical protein